MRTGWQCWVLVGALGLGVAGDAGAQTAFVNFESPHVHPLDLTPDGTRLLAVNTADDRLEVFDVTGPAPVGIASIPVGLDPVSVRARSDNEAWVANFISDSVSIVDLTTGHVRNTLATDDEPSDVVFPPGTSSAFVSCSEANSILVFDTTDLAVPPTRLEVDAESPRALACSPDGASVYAAVFDSGNATTILAGGNLGGPEPPEVVDDPATPYGGVNPPPNAGAAFDPPLNPANPPPGPASLIVRKDDQGAWRDDNGTDWTNWVSGPDAAMSGRPVGWDMPDHDVVVVDTETLGLSYVPRLMNVNMALSVNPATGRLAVVGTDAVNEIRFEPVLRGIFVRVLVGLVDVGATTEVRDLNDHLDYSVPNLPQGERDKSVGDPRGVAWNGTGDRAYVVGMGSNNVVVIDADGDRDGQAPTIEVGEGPTGIVVDDAGSRLFVLNRFEASISVVDTGTELETTRTSFFDPSPAAIRAGRRHLYDTHATSGLGQLSCASCHIDGKIDLLSWDLGNPAGAMSTPTGQNFGAGIPGLDISDPAFFGDWHPMKGPLTTQTLVDIIGKEPLHWRGDKNGIEDFNGAYVFLQGDDAGLTLEEMQEFEDFLATLTFPPNPFRNLDNSLPGDLALPGHFTTGAFGTPGLPLPNGNAVAGQEKYLNGGPCRTCHAAPVGKGSDTFWNGKEFEPFPPGPNGERHHMLVPANGGANQVKQPPQLRDLYRRRGYTPSQPTSRLGFGYQSDGRVESVEHHITEPQFNLQGIQQTADLLAFLLAYSGSGIPEPDDPLKPPGTPSQDAHAAVGTQTTLRSVAGALAEQLDLIDELVALAAQREIGLIAKGRWNGELRGAVWRAGLFQTDRQSERLTLAQLQAEASPASEITFTGVPEPTDGRKGVDRDADGFLDGDELDVGLDPALDDGVWAGLGSGLAGSAGIPLLVGFGPLTGGSPNSFDLTDALPGSTATLVLGVGLLDAAFKGGTLVPTPDVIIGGLPTGAGAINVPFTWPVGIPAGGQLFLQFWVDDPAAPQGLAGSNGLRMTAQ